MNAILKPRPKTLFETMLEDFHNGAPGAHLEAPEVPQWADENQQEMTGQLVDAIKWQADDKALDKLHDLLCCVCRDVTADQLIELRDLLRSLLLDYSIAQAQRMLERELGIL